MLGIQYHTSCKSADRYNPDSNIKRVNTLGTENGYHVVVNIFKCISVSENRYILIEFVPRALLHNKSSLVQAMALSNRRQVITSTNRSIVHGRMYTPPGINALTLFGLQTYAFAMDLNHICIHSGFIYYHGAYYKSSNKQNNNELSFIIFFRRSLVSFYWYYP